MRTIYPGNPLMWISFDPFEYSPHGNRGRLMDLYKIVEQIKGLPVGIIITQDIGITTHIGDILREAAIPSYIHVS